MALAGSGIAVAPDNLNQLTSALTDSGRFTPERTWSERLQDVIQWKVLLWILITLMGMEWIVRRWSGTY